VNELAHRIYEALALLTPYDIDVPKVRIGPNHDGGYVLADRFTPATQPVMSYGISTQYDFDREMAERGHKVFMFDHTIGGIVDPLPNMLFFREGVAGGFSDDLPSGHLGEKPMPRTWCTASATIFATRRSRERNHPQDGRRGCRMGCAGIAR
jgi:hypothetical protein